MKNTWLLWLLFSSWLYAQPFAIGNTSVDLVDAARNNRNINVRVYYPATANGQNATFAAGTFPVIVFGHGFVMSWSAYQNIWEALVPEGFIVAFPTTESGFAPVHLDFAKDLAFVVSALQEANTQPASVFYQKVAAQSGVMGHSMGGGCAHLAASLNSQIHMFCTLAAAETNPSAILASQNIAVPSLVIAASNDCITPADTNQYPMYQAIGNSTCKAYVSLTGGSHCQMANSNFNCSFGEATCSPGPTLTRAQQHALLEPILVGWSRALLQDDCELQTAFFASLATQSGITFEQQCADCHLSNNELTLEQFSIAPNPAEDFIEINMPESAIEEVVVKNLLGQTLQRCKKTAHIRLDHLAAGSYLLVVATPSKIFKSKIFLKK